MNINPDMSPTEKVNVLYSRKDDHLSSQALIANLSRLEVLAFTPMANSMANSLAQIFNSVPLPMMSLAYQHT